MPFFENQKSLFAAAVMALGFVLGVPRTVEAATATGISGVWASKLITHFKVAGYGRRDPESSGNCTVTLRDGLSAGFGCTSFSGGLSQNYSGGISLVIRRTKLGWSLDTAGLDQAMANMKSMLIARGVKRGYVLEPGDISFEFDNFKYHPIKLSKKLSEPEKAKGTIKGRAVQLIKGKYVVKPFTYNVQINFLARVP